MSVLAGIRGLVRSLLLMSVLVMAWTPATAWASAPLPPDHPLMQQVVAQGTATAAAYLTHREPPASAVQGGFGGQPAAPKPVEATVEGFAAYELPSLSLVVQIPEDWELTTDVQNGLFGFRIPGEFSYSFFDTLGQDEFPGLLGLTIFNTRADLLVSSIDENVELEEVQTYITAQGLPGVKIVFAGQISGIDVVGGFYVLATARSVDGLVILTSKASWPDIEPQIDRVASNLTFMNEEETSMVRAVEGPLTYTNPELGISLVLPEGWLLQETSDERVPISMANPDFQITGVVAPIAQDDVDAAALELLRNALENTGQLTNEELQAAMDAIFANSESGFQSSNFTLDPELLVVYPGDTSTVRFGGEGDFDSFTMPVLFYLDVRTDNAVFGLFLGDGETLMEASDTLLEIVRSASITGP